MVVVDVFRQEAFQMPFVENNYMIEQVPATTADLTFGNAVLPRASECCSFGRATHGFYRSDHFETELLVSIKD